MALIHCFLSVFHVLPKKIIEPVVILAQMSRVHCFESLVVVDTEPRALSRPCRSMFLSLGAVMDLLCSILDLFKVLRYGMKYPRILWINGEKWL
jgi:hypothetical protein